jgi:hypothetical protein
MLFYYILATMQLKRCNYVKGKGDTGPTKSAEFLGIGAYLLGFPIGYYKIKKFRSSPKELS